jgi:hypothetical protein
VGVPDSAEVSFEGTPPFTLDYAVNKRGEGDSRQSMTTGTHIARIPLLTDSPGEYTYTVLGFADENYKQPPFRPKSVVQWSQVVHPLPDVWISGGDLGDEARGAIGVEPDSSKNAGQRKSASELQPIAVCKDPASVSGPRVHLGFSGSPPFSAKLRFKHEHHPAQILHVTNITSHEHTFVLPKLHLIGTYTVEPLHVVDGAGCAASVGVGVGEGGAAAGSSDMKTMNDGHSQLTITVSDVARIQAMSPPVVCVGDVLTFSIQGAPPFDLVYRLDNHPARSLTLSDHIVKLLAAEPGVVKIESVCNRNGWCVSFCVENWS